MIYWHLHHAGLPRVLSVQETGAVPGCQAALRPHLPHVSPRGPWPVLAVVTCVQANWPSVKSIGFKLAPGDTESIPGERGEARCPLHSAQLRLSGPIVRHLMLSHNTIIDPSSPLSSVSVSVQSAHNHYQRSAISLITWVWDLGSNVISIWAWPEKILMGQSGLGCTWDIGLCGKMHSTIQGRNVSTALNIQTGTSQKCNRGKGLLNKSRSISPFDYSP